MAVTLITGGARSGKSLWAESCIATLPGRPIYIATATDPGEDGEMAARIASHRARRASAWHEIEAPLDLAAALDASDGAGPRLVDCLTLWLGNLMMAGLDWAGAAQSLGQALARQRAPVFLVTNELGLGIVPDNALAREFRDAQGLLNQQIAAQADRVVLVVAGLPLVLKPQPVGAA